jgi:hypothetical protein
MMSESVCPIVPAWQVFDVFMFMLNHVMCFNVFFKTEEHHSNQLKSTAAESVQSLSQRHQQPTASPCT